MSSLDTLPSSIDVGTGELAQYSIDVTNVLSSGESLQSSPAPTVSMQSNANNAAISGAVTGVSPSGNLIRFNIVGSALQAKQSYTAVAVFNTAASKTLQATVHV